MEHAASGKSRIVEDDKVIFQNEVRGVKNERESSNRQDREHQRNTW